MLLIPSFEWQNHHVHLHSYHHHHLHLHHNQHYLNQHFHLHRIAGTSTLPPPAPSFPPSSPHLCLYHQPPSTTNITSTTASNTNFTITSTTTINFTTSNTISITSTSSTTTGHPLHLHFHLPVHHWLHYDHYMVTLFLSTTIGLIGWTSPWWKIEWRENTGTEKIRTHPPGDHTSDMKNKQNFLCPRLRIGGTGGSWLVAWRGSLLTCCFQVTRHHKLGSL